MAVRPQCSVGFERFPGLAFGLSAACLASDFLSMRSLNFLLLAAFANIQRLFKPLQFLEAPLDSALLRIGGFSFKASAIALTSKPETLPASQRLRFLSTLALRPETPFDLSSFLRSKSENDIFAGFLGRFALNLGPLLEAQ